MLGGGGTDGELVCWRGFVRAMSVAARQARTMVVTCRGVHGPPWHSHFFWLSTGVMEHLVMPCHVLL